VTFKIISDYRQRKMKQVYALFFILLIWNLSCYLWALKVSAPNIGDGYRKIEVTVEDSANLTDVSVNTLNTTIALATEIANFTGIIVN
jgi:hypothetical protein